METQKVSVFFNKVGDECENVSAIERTIPKTAAPGRAAVEELLRGLTFQEQSQYSTNINSGVTIQKLTIENGVAKVDFSSLLNAGVAGSCRVLGIIAQIEKTLLQFPTITSVSISVNGQVDALQP